MSMCSRQAVYTALLANPLDFIYQIGFRNVGGGARRVPGEEARKGKPDSWSS